MSRPQPPEDVVEALRTICAPLPGATEHQAWTGTSWRVAGATFAHVVQIDGGWPPAYAAAFRTAGPATVVTFQADSDERAALGEAGPPFHLPPWRPGVVGLSIDGGTDWRELAELVADSHRLCAMPRRRGRPGRR
ncbi:MAG TPA: MmcQ/YjbR family DNA-binding protein [Acidimicrobiales bacterium]